MKPKPFTIEVLILVIVVLIICWFTGVFTADTYGIDLDDTYIVTPATIVMAPVLLLIFIIYIIKEAFYRYRRRPQNIILLIVLFLINILSSMFARLMAKMSVILEQTKGGTLYPPLSALPQHLHAIRHKPFVNFAQIIFFEQIFFLALLVILAIVTGKNWNTDKNAS